MKVEEIIKLFQDNSPELLSGLDSLQSISHKAAIVAENIGEIAKEGKAMIERVEKLLKKVPIK